MFVHLAKAMAQVFGHMVYRLDLSPRGSEESRRVDGRVNITSVWRLRVEGRWSKSGFRLLEGFGTSHERHEPHGGAGAAQNARDGHDTDTMIVGGGYAL